MLPVLAFGWTEFTAGAMVTLAVSGIWKRVRADPVEELTIRLRHPVRWRLAHPIQAIRRRPR